MLEELRALYEGIIIDHNGSPRNYGLIQEPTHSAEGYNPTCGDQIEVSLIIEADTIKDIRFESSSCAICKASASLMTCSLTGKELSEVTDLENVLDSILVGASFDHEILDQHSELQALGGVSRFPARIKCARLPWKTVRSALKDNA